MNKNTEDYWKEKYPKGAVVTRTTRFERNGVPESRVEKRPMSWYELWLNEVGEAQHRWEILEAIEEEKVVAPKPKPAPKPAPTQTKPEEDGKEESNAKG